jgi:hypothetical protein
MVSHVLYLVWPYLFASFLPWPRNAESPSRASDVPGYEARNANLRANTSLSCKTIPCSILVRDRQAVDGSSRDRRAWGTHDREGILSVNSASWDGCGGVAAGVLRNSSFHYVGKRN